MHSFSSVFRSTLGLFIAIVLLIADMAKFMIRYATGLAWCGASVFRLVAYLVIAPLRPTYRDSYDTHGLSLGGRMRT